MDHDDEVWSRVDGALFQGQRVLAMKLATEDLGVSLGKAIDLVTDRWRFLTEHHLDRFTVSLDGYWANFYS